MKEYKTQIKIEKHLVDEYCRRKYATINVDDAAYIEVGGVIVKNAMESNVEYVTLLPNNGGAFSLEWAQSELKLLFILKESYILKESFYQDGHRGGFQMNRLYDDNTELWKEATYRNIVKITYYAYKYKEGMALTDIDFNQPQVRNEAIEIFRRNAAVISANPFPGLAFNSPYTNSTFLKKWLTIPQVTARLRSTVEELAPKRVFAAFDLGYVSSYSHLFGWLKGKELPQLVECMGEQTVLGNKVCNGGVIDNVVYATDDTGIDWIQGIHPSARLSHTQMQQFAQAISRW